MYISNVAKVERNSYDVCAYILTLWSLFILELECVLQLYIHVHLIIIYLFVFIKILFYPITCFSQPSFAKSRVHVTLRFILSYVLSDMVFFFPVRSLKKCYMYRHISLFNYSHYIFFFFFLVICSLTI